MNVIIEYPNIEYLKIKEIEILSSFNDYKGEKLNLDQERQVWRIEKNLPEGEYNYKFLINKELKLNDPIANMYMPDENDELWSLIVINEKKERLYNNQQYFLHIENYSLSSEISEIKDLKIRKTYDKSIQKKIVSRFEFMKVNGLHAITTIWYSPNGDIFQIAENNLFNPDDKESIYFWFWLPLNESERKIPTGIWKLQLFINGDFILEDNFTIIESSNYSSKGKFSY